MSYKKTAFTYNARTGRGTLKTNGKTKKFDLSKKKEANKTSGSGSFCGAYFLNGEKIYVSGYGLELI